MKTRPVSWLFLILRLTAIPEASRAANLLTNGSFENPPGISTYQVFSGGNSLPGWTIQSGTVEITAGTYWQTAEGAQSLDLNGIFDAIGTIYQDVATTPGHTYKVRFAYAGNPECGLPTLKTANAYWNSQLLTNLSFDISGHNNTNVGWIYYEQTVTATSSNSRIRFQATSPTFCGLTLDDVSVTPLNGPPGNECISTPTGLVGWWRAEGNSTDATGSLDSTTPFGIGYAPGVVGQAFDFNGTSRRVSLPDSAALKLTDSMTIEGWIFIRSYGGFILFRGDNRPGLDPYALVAGPDGNIHFHIESLAASVNLLAPVPSNQWQHVAATLDGSTGDMRMYVNGILTAQANTSVRPLAELDPNSEPAVGIGNHGGTFHQFPFNGLVDELALYSRALSPSEIQSIYTAGSAGKCVPSNPPPSSLAIPVIASFSPISAIVGSTITISGTNFSPVAASNIVFFGAVRATVVSASATSLSVAVPSGATYAPITVTIGGLVAFAARPFQPTFPGDGSSLSASSFASRFDLAGGDGAHRSVIADLDGDGKPDIAVADVYGHTISLFRNISGSGSLSNGSFAPRVVLPAEGGASDNPYGFVVADVDGDGKPDLVACDRLANHISVYRNLASPGSLNADSFAAWVNFSVGADPRYARVADLDGDGRPDIVSANYGANTISILRNTGTPGSLNASSFAPAVDLPAGSGPYDVAIGDLDGDNKPDLAVVCADGPLSLYRNLATQGAITTNSFAPRVDLEGLTGNLTIALGDLDGDGKSDLVFGSYQSRSMSVYRNQASPGPFTTSSFAPRVDFSNGNWAHTVALGDLNGDGRTDIATVGELDSYLSVFQNLSTPGSFASGSLAGRVDFGAGWNAWGVSVGDLDGDGRPDVVFCNAYDDTVSVYQNLVSFTNAPPTNGCVAPPAGVISWWRGEANAYDSMNTNHGALTNGTTLVPGKIGNAFSFDGVDDFVRIPRSPSLDVGDQVTVEFWMKADPTNTMNSYQGLVTSDFFGISIVNGFVLGPLGVAFYISTDGGASVSPSSYPDTATANGGGAVVTAGEWHHVAGTYDGTKLQLYIDGQPWGVPNYHTGAISPMLTNSYLALGAEDGRTICPFCVNDRYFSGLIDEPAVYDRALSAAEIQGIYQAGSAGKCTTSNPPPVTADIIYVAEEQLMRVSVVQANGTLQPYANGVGLVYGLALDHSGNLFAAGSGDDTIRKVTANGDVSVFASSTNLGSPGGLAFDGAGNLFTTGLGWGGTINRINPNGTITRFVTGIGGQGLAFDAGGNLFVASGLNVIKVAPDGTASTFASGFSSAWGLAFDQNGNLFVSDASADLVRKITPGGVVSVFAQGLDYPTGLAFDSHGNLFVCNITRTHPLGHLSKITPDGTVSIYATGLNYPTAVAIKTQATTCTPARSGLVSWWRGENSTADAAGGNPGTVTGSGTVSFAPGEVGQAFRFDGADGGIQVSASTSLNVGLGAGLTIETWIKPSTIELERPIAEWNSVTGGHPYPYGVHFWISVPAGYGDGPGCLYANLMDTAGNFHWLTSAGGLINTNSFQHVAVTYDQSSGVAMLFLDGAVVAQRNLGSFTPQTGYNLYLGSRPGGVAAAYHWAGLMDEVSLYSRALSQTEIQAIHAAGSAGKCLASNPQPPSYWLTGPITNSANNHWYYLLDATNWPAAEQIAVSLGGHLATINDAGENLWVYFNFSTFGGADRALWIGFTDSAQENIWQWTSGAPATYVHWASGEPNNGGGFFPNENHALMLPPSSAAAGGWNDAPEDQLHAAVVEVSAPEPIILAGPVTNWMNGHWYYLLNHTNWPAAEQIAVSLGGHLVTINNAEENLWVYDAFSLSGGLERPLWIGLTDAAEEGTWRWVSGEATTFLNWAVGEPNSGGGVFPDEDRAMIWHPGSGFEFGTWNDGPSNHHAYAVVEVAPPSNHPPIVQLVFAPLAHLPGISNHLVISPVCAPATVILDASRSADADHDALHFAWRQGTNIFATSCLVTNHLNPGIYQLELRVSDAAASPTTSFTLQVITPRQAVGLISNLVQSASLDATLAAALLSPLRAAALAFDRCTASAGSDQLEVFQNRVRANEATLSAERADEFLAAAQEIICALKAAEPPALPGMAIQKATRIAGGQFHLRFTGEPGRICFIEATSDWVRWETIGVAAEGGPGTYEFLDVDAGQFPGRFYRAVSP